jgi:hypothetical protein
MESSRFHPPEACFSGWAGAAKIGRRRGMWMSGKGPARRASGFGQPDVPNEVRLTIRR